MSRVSTYRSGQFIRLRFASIGVTEGPSPAHGAGQHREVPAGDIGEVVDVDASTGWLDVIFAHNFGGPHSPFHTRVILEPDAVELADRPGLPEIVLPEPPEDLQSD